MTADQLELPTATDVCALVFGDPRHAEERAAVIDAIETDAAAHSGHVDPNRVRALIPSWVNPRVVGATYNALRTRGRLVRDEFTTSTDRHGRNVGKMQPTYRLVGE